ncbi:replication initiation and membrane attachment family protein [Metabacillus herbersteinensis]|uniref:Replication initiation and membrane attachment family protein n=1 Tax=Metabacillus herbersteinensis TaxID=283816 RepID=A0ABV6G9A6_9BACI
MGQHWKELLAIDRYVVRSNCVLQDFDRKILTMLYQPLIGSMAYSLFMTLWSEMEQDRLWGEETTHHSLMVMMQSNLNGIYQERLKLEGIGLLKTYFEDKGEYKRYVYELQSPLNPNDFFQDGVLNIYLYNRIGKSKFQQLKRFFSDRQVDKEVKEVTRTFNDVFHSLHPAEMASRMTEESIQDISNTANTQYVQAEDPGEIIISSTEFNFDLLYNGISEAIIPKKSITSAVQETIKKLSYLYGIDAIEMKNVLMSAIEHDDSINLELLRKSARDWYQFQHGDKLPALSEKTQPATLRTVQDKKDRTKEEELIYQLETISPRRFLKDVSGGINPTASDLQIIEETMFQQKLEAGVVNVLIYYVMLKTDMKLSRAYVQKIASHWSRKELKTVKAAMDLAKQEHRQYQEWAETKNKPKPKKAAIRKELLPAWLKDEQTEPKEKKVNASEQVNFEAEKQKLAERIQKFKNNQ